MANSRETIISALKKQQRVESPALSVLKNFNQSYNNVSRFEEVLQKINAKVYHIKNTDDIINQIKNDTLDLKRIVSSLTEFSSIAEVGKQYTDLSSLGDVDLFITRSFLGVAENGAVWLKEENLQERVLPFIAKHLAVIIDRKDIVATMHEAYQKIGNAEYGFATFIAGPSRTADIEQSLVVGAHGAMSMRVFIM